MKNGWLVVQAGKFFFGFYPEEDWSYEQSEHSFVDQFFHIFRHTATGGWTHINLASEHFTVLRVEAVGDVVTTSIVRR